MGGKREGVIAEKGATAGEMQYVNRVQPSMREARVPERQFGLAFSRSPASPLRLATAVCKAATVQTHRRLLRTLHGYQDIRTLYLMFKSNSARAAHSAEFVKKQHMS